MANFSLLPKTFEDVKAYLLEKIQAKYPALGVFLGSGLLSFILDVISYAVALFMDFAENLNDEGKLFSAKKFENVRQQAAFFKYDAKRKISAQGTIKVGMTANFNTLPTESITFKENDAIQINGIPFLILEDITFSSNPLDTVYAGLPTGTYYITIPVIQGTFTQETKTAQGLQNEFFEITNPNIENGYLKVTRNSVEWTQVREFIRSSSVDEVYKVENLQDMAGISTVFGDGFRGVKLVAGDAIVVSFRETQGLNGQIKTTGLPVTFLEA